MTEQQLPVGAQPIALEEVFQTIGELWFQNRQYQRLIAQMQQQLANLVGKSEQLNGSVEHAVLQQPEVTHGNT